MSTAETINNLGPYAHNPRGNLWFKDESTFGHKLLMKMGWKHGKGLGKNENGIKENLSVKFRNTNSGLGYKDDPYANIMKTEYETILKNLNEKYSDNKSQATENENSDQEKGFNKKSKVVKSKIRYPKLFFGKDVNKYSEKDMKSIFICSLPSNDKEKLSEDSAVSQNKTVENEVPEVTETISSSLSISEYFAKKMEEKKNNILRGKCNGDLDNQEPFSGPKNSQEILSSNRLTKKRKKKSDVNFSPESKSGPSLQQLELESEVAETAGLASLSSKKSSKKIKSLKDISIVATNSQSDDEKDAIKSPKKKKRKLSQSNLFENDKNLNSKQKKSKVLENGLSSDNNFMHDTHKDKISCQIELSPSVALELNNRSKKKSKNKKTTSVTESNAENGFQEIDKSIENSSIFSFQPPLESLENGDIACTKRKKKNKKLKLRKLKSCLKNKRCSYSLKNVSFNDSVSFKVIDTDFEASYSLDDVSSLDKRNLSLEIVDNDISDLSSCISEELQCDEKLTEMVEEYGASEEESDMQTENNVAIEVQEVLSKSEVGDSMSGISSSKSLFNNSCIEDQKQEMKAGMSKKLLKSLKKNRKLHCDEELTEIVDKSEVSEGESDIQAENNTNTEQEVLSKSEDGDSTSGMPSSKSLFNNSCIEDQKQEMKAGMSKKLFKSLKKNPKLHCDEELTEIVDKSEVSEGESDMQAENNTNTEQEVLSKSEDGCSVLSLPSSESPYNNSWVEDQKQALKMKMYKKMLKSLKKHEILGTSNLVSIKGYGNWGF